MKKIGLLSLALVLALGGLGIGYAAWTDSLAITGSVTTGHVEWELQPPLTNSDPPLAGSLDWNVFFDLNGGNWVLMDKDVGSTTLAITDSHTMTVTIDNAYPYYTVHIAFKVHGLGSVPLRIWKADFLVNDIVIATIYDSDEYIYLNLDGQGGDDLEIWWGNGFGRQLHESDKHDISFDLLVLQPAPQNASLTFSIELWAVQFDQYTPGPIPE